MKRGEMEELQHAIKAIPLPENVMLLEPDQASVLLAAGLIEMSRACSWKIVLCEVPTEKDESEGPWHPEYAVLEVGYKAAARHNPEETLEERVSQAAENLARRIEKKRALIQ